MRFKTHRLVAAITMSLVLANMPGVRCTEERPFLKTAVHFTIGLLLISISPTVTVRLPIPVVPGAVTLTAIDAQG
jgi:hypothetical protein